MFSHTITFSPLKPYRKWYAFLFFELLVEKIGQKFAREVLNRAFQKCGSRPPIVLLVEIDFSS